ncbi:MAG: hypothetical protein PUD20_10100 [bacterium]|nr:hypothetical protein [bacterium]
MKKTFRILAIIGCICLVGMNLVTFILAMTDDPNTMVSFRASLYCTIIIPVLLWTYSMVYRVLKGRNEKESHPLPDTEKNTDDQDVLANEIISDEKTRDKIDSI